MNKLFPAFFVIFLVAGACLDEPDCYLLNNNVVGIAFKQLADPAKDAEVDLKAMGSLTPPLLFFTDTSLTRLTLPLNYLEDETIYFFVTGSDTSLLRLGYRSQAQFVSEDCGERYFLTQLRVVEHDFDSVRLITDFPARQGGTLHLQIFR